MMDLRSNQCRAISMILLAVLLSAGGCNAPAMRLSFPKSPLFHDDAGDRYDVDRDGRTDFSVTYKDGRVDSLEYDDNQDGAADRIYHLSDYAAKDVPHVLILLDSVPYQTVADRYAAGDLRMFGSPAKIIAPFPSLTEICYTDFLHAPPLPGVIDQHYDPRIGKRRDALWQRVLGYSQPWERRCDHILDMRSMGLSYLNPRPWYSAELEMGRRVVEASPNRLSIIYFGSASGMACKYGKIGVDEVIDGARQLCLQLLYERRGAVRITMLADHGHNYAPSTNIDLAALLKTGGMRPVDRIERDEDVVVEINGLVTCAGLYTRQPARAAEIALKNPAIELAMYMDGDRVVVRGAEGSAEITAKNGRLTYAPVDTDVLKYSEIMHVLKRDGLADADGFASDDAWLARTADHAWPDAPRRIWDAFHRQVVNAPIVLLSVRDGFCTGLPEYERFIKMESTHGGLNQINSATFILTTHGTIDGPLRQVDVLRAVDPDIEPNIIR